MTKNRAAKKDVRAAKAAFGGKYTDHLNAIDYWSGSEVTLPKTKHKPYAPREISNYLRDMNHDHLDGALLTMYLIQQNVAHPDAMLDWLEYKDVRDEINRAFDWSAPVPDERAFAQRLIAVIHPIEECWIAYCRAEDVDIIARTFGPMRYSGAARTGEFGRDRFLKSMKYDPRTNSYIIPLAAERIRLITEAFAHPAFQGVQPHHMYRIGSIYDVVGRVGYVRKLMDAMPVTDIKDAHPGTGTFQWGVDFKADVRQLTSNFIGSYVEDPAVRAIIDDPETSARLRRACVYIDDNGVDREITIGLFDDYDDYKSVMYDDNGNPITPEERRKQRAIYRDMRTRSHTFVS